ncbi:DNA-3-methyladenine glycosylase I [Legionella maceachernii]|uniref:3-methyladenine DNA glycosylase n=1 Tax=Legionella maceachernii TaxID=466 RepID=A0A0W0VUZ7_9GAMM|nr:DNA-3-methyladenine glycosylase I [Legionella maceachernii]KTD24055.1 3-methyladenine DNA glycosylase [Legionella maceachernii]SJZ85055.1 DNA-3-methyladenine glycosylase I [Legionella maceachernii]SUO99255.1 DNA-3-methyladenine glycosylase 1 [Legionella maceachernii]
MQRCAWCTKDPLYTAYHDEEWGVPVRNPPKLFEMIVLESMQAGLSWLTVLRKREAMRHAFYSFSPEKLARLTDEEIQVLLSNEAIIRNRLKIKSVKTNAQSFLRIAEHENIVDYFWQFTDGKIIQNKRNALSEIPAITTESTAMAKQLKKDGFVFMGPTTCYAFMQSVGIVNDHLLSCFRYNEIAHP